VVLHHSDFYMQICIYRSKGATSKPQKHLDDLGLIPSRGWLISVPSLSYFLWGLLIFPSIGYKEGETERHRNLHI